MSLGQLIDALIKQLPTRRRIVLDSVHFEPNRWLFRFKDVNVDAYYERAFPDLNIHALSVADGFAEMLILDAEREIARSIAARRFSIDEAT